jgi:TPR repeat protein
MSKLDEISHDVKEALQITTLAFTLLAKRDIYSNEALEMAAEHMEHNAKHDKETGDELLLLATIIRNGIVDCNGAPTGTNPRSEKLDLLKQHAEQGDAEAQFNLGVMYDNGDGVAQNYAEAVRWYRLAAKQGYAVAQNYLGAMYDNGEGVERDHEEAVRWYRLADGQENEGEDYVSYR